MFSRAALIEKAQKDPAFLALLKENPHQALGQFGLHDLPKNLKIHVVCETAQERWLVIPNTNLEGVAGGNYGEPPACTPMIPGVSIQGF